jgi:regulatory protein
MARAVRHLSQRDHSRLELRNRLLRQAPESADGGARSAASGADPDSQADAGANVDAVLDRLQALGYLDDARVAHMAAASRSSRHGLRRIRQDLAQRGVELGEAEAASLRDSEAERAAALWRRRFGDPPATLREWQQQARFLVSRGFEPEVARRVVGAVPARSPGGARDDEVAPD